MDSQTAKITVVAFPLTFVVGQNVTVNELGRPGVIISIHITASGPKYETRYFWNGEAKEVYFFDWEITARA